MDSIRPLDIGLQNYLLWPHAYYSLFVYYKGDIFMASLIYVDDIVLASNNTQVSKAFKKYVHACFSIDDLGPLKYLLGIEVARGFERLFLCQRKYALEIGNECGLLGAKPLDFAIEKNHKLVLASDRLLNDATRYRRLVVRLIYLTITRPELTYVILIPIRTILQGGAYGGGASHSWLS